MKPTDWISAISAIASAVAAIVALYIANSNYKNSKKDELQKELKKIDVLEDTIAFYIKKKINKYIASDEINKHTRKYHLTSLPGAGIPELKDWIRLKISTADSLDQLRMLHIGEKSLKAISADELNNLLDELHNTANIAKMKLSNTYSKKYNL